MSVRGRAEQSLVWHLRLGHVFSAGSIQRHITNGTLPSVRPQTSDCTACLKAKYRKAYIGSLTEATTVEHLRADVKGIVKTRSACDASFFVAIVKVYSRFFRATPIGNKSEVSDQVLAFVRWFERRSGQPIRSFHSDGGKEFLQARNELKSNGFDVKESAPYAPHSNGLTKRHVDTVLNAALAAF